MLLRSTYLLCILLAITLCQNNRLSAQNCITCSSTHTTLSQGLVFCLPLNGGILNDQGYAGFQATSLNGPGSVNDRFGTAFNAMAFNGTNQFIKYGDILDTLFCKTPTSRFTVSGWAKSNVWSSSRGVIVAKSAGGASANEWMVYQASDGTVRGIVYSSATDYLEWKSTAPIPVNQWFFFTLIFNGATPLISNRVVMYVNGFPTAFSASNGTIDKFCANTAQEITIGATHQAGLTNTPTLPYNGAVDEIRIYNRILTNAEISELYNGTPLQIPTLPDLGVCIGDSVQIHASGGATYTWFPSTNLSATNIPNPYSKPTATRTYFLTIANGSCSNKDTVVVNVNQNCCVLSQSISSKNNNLLYFVPINNDARDVSLNPATPVVQGATTQLSTDRFNNKNSVYSFSNSTSDKLISSADPKLSFPANQSFTISVWAKARNIQSHGSRIISVFKNGGYELILAPTNPVGDAGKIEFRDFDGASATTKVSLLSDSALRMNEWYLISLSVNKDDSTSRLFLNGRLAGSFKGLNSIQNACGVSIGNHNLNPLGFDGLVDEIRIYNYALSNDEMLDLFYKGKSHIMNQDTTICSGDSVQIQTFGNASAYSWSPSTGLDNPFSANPVARPMATTTYILSSTNGSCIFKDTLTIYVNYAEANAGIDTILCKGDSIQLNGSGGASFTWLPPAGLSNPFIANPYAKPGVDTDYLLTVYTAGCSSSDTVHVAVNEIIPNAGPDLNLCYGDSVQLSANGGTGYAWNPSTGLSNINIFNPFAKPLTTTTYTVNVSRGFCSVKDSLKITVIQILPDAGLPQQICPGDSVQLLATGGNQYAWINNGFVSDTSLANPYVTPTSTATFYVFAKIGSCAVMDSVEVIVKSNLVTSAGNDDEICFGESVQLNATGGTLFSWSPASGLNDANIAAPVATPSTTTDYILFSRSGNCTAYDTVTITVNPLPIVELGNDTTACLNQPFLLTPTIANANVFNWTPVSFLDNPTVPYPSATINTPTQFFIQVENSITGCSSSDSIWVGISIPTAKIAITPDKGDAPLTVQTSNFSTPLPMTYEWTFAETPEYYSFEKQPEYTFNTPGKYLVWLTATDQFGCTATDTAEVQVYDVMHFFIPNAFTPNGDRNNESFVPRYPAELVQYVQGTIYNKWGETVYTFKVPGDPWWNGKIKDEYAPDGVYLYSMEVLDLNNRLTKFKGSVTLLR
ncbi:MAG: LamG-like jellyroll fold domain-containing protein [Bacteroidia bacterium]